MAPLLAISHADFGGMAESRGVPLLCILMLFGSLFQIKPTQREFTGRKTRPEECGFAIFVVSFGLCKGSNFALTSYSSGHVEVPP